jgi:hypothetical protein
LENSGRFESRLAGKHISCGLPISGGFLADLTNFAWVCFGLADSGGFGPSVSKTTTFVALFLPYKKSWEQIFLCKIFSKKKKKKIKKKSLGHFWDKAKSALKTHKIFPYGEKRPKIIPISGGFLADLINSAWRILVDFYIRSGGFEKNHLATLAHVPVEYCLRVATPKHQVVRKVSNPSKKEVTAFCFDHLGPMSWEVISRESLGSI